MNDETQETVQITRKEYDELLESQKTLYALQAGGVDNWDGYDFCFED